MAMSEEERHEKVQRLRTAYVRTREVLDRQERVHDLHAGTDIANNFVVLTVAYMGLEQTFKYLIAVEDGRTIEEITAQGGGYRHHNLARLFEGVSEEDQAMASEFYARFQSLHMYVPWDNARDFLRQISGERGEGYEKWRYALIQDTDDEENAPPLNSGEAMMAVWQAAMDLAERGLREDDNRFEMYEEHLEVLCFEILSDSHDEVYRSADDENWDGELVHREIGEWIANNGGILNAFSSILRREARVGHHDVAFENEWSARVLTKCLERISVHTLRRTYSNLACFADRAQGRYAVGSEISWDARTNRFENIPWSLEQRHIQTPPETSIEIRHWGAVPDKRHRVYRAAENAGYLVLENHWFGDLPRNHRWMQTIEVRSDATPDSFCVLELWEGRHPQDRAYLRVVCDLDLVSPDVRTVIDYYERQNRIRVELRH